MHRRAVPCKYCGKMFFPASLPFHMKVCESKQVLIEYPCPYCDAPFRYLLF